MSEISVEQLEQMLFVAPFHRWMNLKVLSVSPDSIEIEMPWRDEIVSNPEPQVMHGGILASLIDLAGLYTILAAGVMVSATADLHVDYHRAATKGPVRVKTQLLKLGKRISSARAEVFSEDGKLLASGRGAYLTAS